MKYINNKTLLSEIIEYKKTNIISEKLHLLLYELAKNIAYKPNWINYTWIDDMISDAYLKCLIKLDKYDINKSNNPFSYFTSVIGNFYIDYIKKYKYHEKIIQKLENNFKKRMQMQYNIDYSKMKLKKDNI